MKWYIISYNIRVIGEQTRQAYSRISSMNGLNIEKHLNEQFMSDSVS